MLPNFVHFSLAGSRHTIVRSGRSDLRAKAISTACFAERVKVVVRVRHPNTTETAGGIEISDDSSSITLQRK